MKSRAFSKKSQFWSIFEISLDLIPSQSRVVIYVRRHNLALLGITFIIIMTCYGFIVKNTKIDFRYIPRKRDELDKAFNGLITFVYKFFSVGEGLVLFAFCSRIVFRLLIRRW